jgi:hypothetical protein
MDRSHTTASGALLECQEHFAEAGKERPNLSRLLFNSLSSKITPNDIPTPPVLIKPGADKLCLSEYKKAYQKKDREISSVSLYMSIVLCPPSLY